LRRSTWVQLHSATFAVLLLWSRIMRHRPFTGTLAGLALLLGAALPSLSVQAQDRPWYGHGSQRADDDRGRRDHDRDNRRYHKRDDNTGTVVGAVLLGAGLLYILSQAGKKKKNDADTAAVEAAGSWGGGGGSWNNPDSGDGEYGPSGERLSRAQSAAIDACTDAIARDVRAQGGSNVTVDKITRVSGNDRIDIVGDWIAIFARQDVRTRTVTCTVENDRVLQYRVS
jgi:hypothetical protein